MSAIRIPFVVGIVDEVGHGARVRATRIMLSSIWLALRQRNLKMRRVCPLDPFPGLLFPEKHPGFIRSRNTCREL